MTYLGGSLAGMTADRNLWKSRADQAWGRNRIWNNGLSWESEFNTSQANLATMTTNYNNMVAERDAWINNYNQAIASRDYWQHTVAHNDANVWDNRYNAGHSAGYSAGAASKGTNSTASSTMLRGVGGLPNSGTYSGDLIAVNAQRTGLAHVSCIAISNPSEDVTLHIFRNGVLQVNGQNGAGGWNVHFAVQGTFQVNQGDYITIRGWGDPGDQASIGSMYLICTTGSN